MSGRRERSVNEPAKPLFESLEPRTLLSSSISGIVFNDANSNGHREVGEAGLSGQRVFLDQNFNGKFDTGETSLLTDSTGAYNFTGLGAGIVRVRVVVPSGQRQTSPNLLFYDIPANGSDIHVANDFGLTVTAVVRGTVFNDTNGDGVRQITEQGVQGIRVYIDKNGNGKFDPGKEKSRITDASGAWRFAGLAKGKYTIRVVLPPGMHVTAPSRGFQLVRLAQAQSLSNRLIGLDT
ncbi:MAG TPA: SdrD B-like domain-containing protein [Tepidisphaeraceae bacterium]|jgi:hypothetical protein